MKKLLAIIGSPRGYNSKTYEIANKILKKLESNTNIKVSSKIHILSELDINKCKGCLGCFINCGPCVSFTDSMCLLENDMMDADLIIFASPVYAHNITGDMKIFFDRISYWLHIMKLVGKYGITISTSSSNGNIFVDNYLGKMMEFLGIKIIDEVSYVEQGQFNEESIESCISKIIGVLNDEIYIKSNEFKEHIFGVYKKVYLETYEKGIANTDYIQNKEAKYWHDNGYFDCDSFEELFELMKN